ncbi:MAG: DUF370 domain-containing protein [Candidatus Krumholzibacteriota bacterium]|nr:DUF370 domain-containing protein [Candidatus Krumholzibacteriota bacterium]
MLLNIGFGNVVAEEKVVAVVNSDSAPMRRYREEARQSGMLVDATQGRKTRSVIVTVSGHIILSAIAVETIGQRWKEKEAEDGGETK